MGIVFRDVWRRSGALCFYSIGVHGSILFGDMLGVSLGILGATSVIALGIALIIGLSRSPATPFDARAKASGLEYHATAYGLPCMIALTIVATLKSVGIVRILTARQPPAQLPFADATLCARWH